MEFHAQIHEDSDGSYWAEVQELPGCFASGFSPAEVVEALQEAIELYLDDEPRSVRPSGLTLVTA